MLGSLEYNSMIAKSAKKAVRKMRMSVNHSRFFEDVDNDSVEFTNFSVNVSSLLDESDSFVTAFSK